MESPHISIAPGKDSYDALPSGFQATCPVGYHVVGTGFNGGIGKVTEVRDFGGVLVGGFFINDTSITITDVHVQAICGVVASSAASDMSARSAVRSAHSEYEANLRSLEAAYRHRG